MTRVLQQLRPQEPLDLEPASKRPRIGEDEEVDEMVAIPGDRIADPENYMRGHGTYLLADDITEDNEEMTSSHVLASVAGTIEHVNRLVTVRPLRSRYRPEVGDLIVGRISEVGPRRWKVDAGGRQDAVLMLSSINLPGGVQRRKVESDELQMRAFFAEGDLLVAEVQAFFADGAMSLHTRSLKYGKLRNGRLVKVSPSLIVRLKSHFHTLPCGVDLIIGMNGHIWISSASSDSSASHVDAPVDAEHVSSADLYSDVNDVLTPARREAIARVTAVILVLAEALMPLNFGDINEAYEASLDLRGADDDDIDDVRGNGMDDGTSTNSVKKLVHGSNATASVVRAVLDARARHD